MTSKEVQQQQEFCQRYGVDSVPYRGISWSGVRAIFAT